MVQSRRRHSRPLLWMAFSALALGLFVARLAMAAQPDEDVVRLPAISADVSSPLGAVASEKKTPSSELAYPDTARLASPDREKSQMPESRAAHRQPVKAWHEPETLIETLNALPSTGSANRWAGEVLQRIHALGRAMDDGSPDAAAILDRLAALDRDAMDLAAKCSDRSTARKLRKASYALGRRIEIWRQVARLDASELESPKHADTKRLSECLAAVEAVVGDSAEGRAWRNYLLIDALKKFAAEQPLHGDKRLQRTAAKALAHMVQTPLAPEQQQFITSELMTSLRIELCRWAAEPVGVAALLNDIERYERTGLPNDANRLAMDCQYLSGLSTAGGRQLARRVDEHYRNANVRIAVTEDLINRMIPEQKLEYAPVNETVLGHPIRGQSLMATKLAVRMVPDPKRVLLALEVTGEIAALTTTDAGPARFHSDSESYYIARKPMEIDMNGISLWPVEIDVQNKTRLRGVDTAFKVVPLIGPVVKGIAESQMRQSQPAAIEEVKQKVAAQARERIDAETRQQLSGVVDQMNRRVFDPLNTLMLDPQMIDAQTTEKRFTMRLRLGGEDQLGSHTPRPQAPEDSLFSMQIHESVLNNGIERLQLAGRKFPLPELAKHVAAKLNLPSPLPVNPDNDDVEITFAEKDPIVVRCQDGQVVVTLSIAQLSKSPRKWNDFQVRAFYKPQINGRSAALAREGVIHLIGRRLSAGSQIALRGIFSRTFSKKSPWELMPDRIRNEPKLKESAVTQFMIDDGWIGLALGPKTSVPMVARRPR